MKSVPTKLDIAEFLLQTRMEHQHSHRDVAIGLSRVMSRPVFQYVVAGYEGGETSVPAEYLLAFLSLYGAEISHSTMGNLE